MKFVEYMEELWRFTDWNYLRFICHVHNTGQIEPTMFRGKFMGRLDMTSTGLEDREHLKQVLTIRGKVGDCRVRRSD